MEEIPNQIDSGVIILVCYVISQTTMPPTPTIYSIGRNIQASACFSPWGDFNMKKDAKALPPLHSTTDPIQLVPAAINILFN